MLIFENVAVLFGLAALAVPIVVHFLQRRQYETIHWGAMQFLPTSNAIARKRWLDEIPLMLLRMAVIALIVLALTTPISTSPLLSALGESTARDAVVVIDGSYSMDMRLPGQHTPWDDALRWLGASEIRESALIVIARQPPVAIPGGIAERASTGAHGNPDMPAALALAWNHLEQSKTARKEIIVLTDGQRHGWADTETLAAFESLGNVWRSDVQRAKTGGLAVPSLRVVKVGPELTKLPPNYALAPLSASHRVIKPGRKVVFESALRLENLTAFTPPRWIKAQVEGLIVPIPVPQDADLKNGQIPLRFEHAFKTGGEHVVSLMVEPDPAFDALAADNAQHLVVEVVNDMPIVLVEGDAKVGGASSSYFLERVFSKPALPISELGARALAGRAVLVLADVARLTPAQIAAIERFLADGGGLLVAAGQRVAADRERFNALPWVPARLGEIASAKNGARPDPATFQHPAIALFRAAPEGISQVRFEKWWRVDLDRGVPIARLDCGDPLLVEMPYKKGRVLLCTVPLDRGWGSTLPSSVEFPILMHELAYYLAGGRTARHTLLHGAPIVLTGTPVQRLTLRTPEFAAKSIDVKRWPWVYEDTGAIGVCRVQMAPDRSAIFVTPPDLRESDLMRCSEEDWRRVRERLRVAWELDSAGVALPPEAQRQELWWLFLLAALGFLCLEVWMTRRLAIARGV